MAQDPPNSWATPKSYRSPILPSSQIHKVQTSSGESLVKTFFGPHLGLGGVGLEGILYVIMTISISISVSTSISI